MTTALLWGIAGLAALDAFNPATIVAVTLVLLAAPRWPGLTAAMVVIGAAMIVFSVGAVLFLTVGAAAGAVGGTVVGLRFLAFGAAAIGLVIAGVRRFKDRPRRPIALPRWFTPATAIPFGILITAADLPNAFPYFIAIERLVSADIGIGQGLLVLAGYTIVYCLPCIVLLIVGLLARRKTREWLDRIVQRFGTGVVRRSLPLALLLIATGLFVASVPFWL